MRLMRALVTAGAALLYALHGAAFAAAPTETVVATGERIYLKGVLASGTRDSYEAAAKSIKKRATGGS